MSQLNYGKKRPCHKAANGLNILFPGFLVSPLVMMIVITEVLYSYNTQDIDSDQRSIFGEENFTTELPQNIC